MNSNMNYFMSNIPDEYFYLNQMQNTKNFIDNQDFNNTQINSMNNLNYNKCNYNGNASPNGLYSAYEGFTKGNMFPELYSKYTSNEPYEIKSTNNQDNFLAQIGAYGFASHDLNLYLDTHPNDKSMIDLYNKYADDTKKLVNEYENQYGKLFVNSTQTDPWSWNNDPWPWEN